MEDFAEHYGLVVLPARPRKPKDKASVENTVKLIYQRVFAKLRNQLFFSLAELNAAIIDKVREHNQTRMQREAVSRLERFLADEKHLLKALPKRLFEKRYYAELIVASNNGHQMRRSPDYYIGLAARRSAGLTRLIKRIFDVEKTPELAFRTCDGMLKLQRKTQPDIFEEACEIAYNNDLLGYKRLSGIIRQCALAKTQQASAQTTLLPIHDNIRGKDYYN